MVRGVASRSTRRKWRNSSNKADKRIGCLRVSATRWEAVSGGTSHASTEARARAPRDASPGSGGSSGSIADPLVAMRVAVSIVGGAFVPEPLELFAYGIALGLQFREFG